MIEVEGAYKASVLVCELKEILNNPSIFNKHRFSCIINDLAVLNANGEVKKLIDEFRFDFPSICSNKTLQGRAFVKEYGYAGDFEIIDKIYQYHVNEDPLYLHWDEYFQEQSAPKAVRNRKDFFKKIIVECDNKKSQHVLNLASGPCRDLYELFEENPFLLKYFTFDCLDSDIRAINYGKGLLIDYLSNVNFINTNVFRYTNYANYDIIWSAGLFDYFDDSTFVRLLKRFYTSNSDAKIIIGNFSVNNPTSAYMALIGEWFLHQRSENVLIKLAEDAGIPKEKVRVESESEGVNLFLIINF